METSMLSKRIEEFLKKQHIHVPDDWIDACLEWLQNENDSCQNALILQKQVYEQWLLTDLSELGTPILPSDITDEKCTLNGVYCLQMNSIINISQPLYGQLLEVQKKDNSNSNVSAETQPTQKPWEGQPQRMFLMKLTDGVTEVSAIEYRHIACLNSKLSPGCKVKLKGPFLCRRSVLMLTSSNLELLGGEVEELFSSYNHHSILCHNLGRDLPRNIDSLVEGAAQGESHSDIELPDELVSQLTDDAFDLDGESGYLSGSRVLPDQSNNVTSSVPMSLDDDVNDLNMLIEVERVEASQRSLQVNFPAERQSTARTDFHQEVNESSTGLLTSKPVIDLTGDRTTIVQPQSRKHAKQLMIKDAFNQNFKSLPEHLQRCASGPLPSERNTDTYCSGGGNFTVTTTPLLSKASSSSYSIQRPQISSSEKGSLTGASVSDNLSTYSSEISIPLKYLCQIKKLSADLKTRPTTLLVKACVVTLLSKLKSDSIQGWSLNARICDGTDVLDVQFSDRILTDLIGYSSSQAEAIKKSYDPVGMSGLKNGMSRCRDTIIEMCKLMFIELPHATENLPIVLQLKEADQAYWDSIS